MANEICLQCKQRVKRKDHQFCSKRCTEMAAKKAPQLLRVPKGHVMYNDVKKHFKRGWKNPSARLPTVTRIYLITWSVKMRSSFEQYRYKLCKKPEGVCRLCTAIRTGFKYSLQYKRKVVKQVPSTGVRFGGGLYMAPTSSKAYQYAKNQSKGSKLKAVLMARVVLGIPERMSRENVTKLKPKQGCDSVETHVGSEPTELVVYTENAARPAYLLMLK
ncbi:hypothetical protein BDW22DRAFT_1333278 [Trametopsis cervina]|nr:hypothetical protein BDW22DRAFT_1333278 [Trametopsis cervina]